MVKTLLITLAAFFVLISPTAAINNGESQTFDVQFTIATANTWYIIHQYTNVDAGDVIATRFSIPNANCDHRIMERISDGPDQQLGSVTTLPPNSSQYADIAQFDQNLPANVTRVDHEMRCPVTGSAWVKSRIYDLA